MSFGSTSRYRITTLFLPGAILEMPGHATIAAHMPVAGQQHGVAVFGLRVDQSLGHESIAKPLRVRHARERLLRHQPAMRGLEFVEQPILRSLRKRIAKSERISFASGKAAIPLRATSRTSSRWDCRQ
ncbi:MAG: hypothetical protein R3D67_01320 [Hyphomicrobiaceae bacterium]